MGKVINLKGYPNPRQIEFFKATARHIAYGGSRGGGKSWAMRRKFVLLAMNYPNLKILLLRRTMPELLENHLLPLQSELYGFANYKDTQKSFIFPNGSRIKLGYCDAEKDIYQYQGQEFDVIGLEEATHFTEAQKDFLTTCNRSTRTDFKPRMYYTSNPGNVGHVWFKRLFIDRQYRNKERSEDYIFIPAKVYDNKVLMDTNPEYIEALENLPEELRKAHLDGDWNVFAGQYYSEFRTDIHTIDAFPVPKHWRRFVSMDWGYNDYCSVLWHAVNDDGRVYTYRELYVRQTLASDVAMQINRLSRDENIDYYVAGHDIWQTRGTGNSSIGESISEVFLKHGIIFMKADIDRLNGWNRIHEYFKKAPDGLPYVQIFKNCTNLIRSIPQLIHDEIKVEDVAHDPHEITNSADSFRYGLMSRPAPNEIEKIKIEVLPDALRTDDPMEIYYY